MNLQRLLKAVPIPGNRFFLLEPREKYLLLFYKQMGAENKGKHQI